MNLELMREKMRDAKTRLDEMRAKAIGLASGEASNEDMDACEKELKAARRGYELIKAECDAMEKEQRMPEKLQPVDKKEDKSLKAMLASNEYARSFYAALRMGAKPGRNAAYSEELKPVYDALTIAGGDPEGADGGFLVPEDIDRTIRETMRAFSPLSDLFTVENVNTKSGWRVFDTAPTKGFTKLDGEMSPVPRDDQPAFQRANFTLDTYGLILPVSNELKQDEVANLFSYLGRWFGRKLVITENTLLLNELAGLTPEIVASDASPLSALKTALNVGLDPAISLRSVVLTNQDGFNVLDQEKDESGKPLLQPDPTNSSLYRAYGRRVAVLSNAQMPGDEGGAPLFVGDFTQLATLFRRMPLEMKSTDIGGNAWNTNSTEVRGIVRLGTASFDKEAAVYRKIALA